MVGFRGDRVGFSGVLKRSRVSFLPHVHVGSTLRLGFFVLVRWLPGLWVTSFQSLLKVASCGSLIRTRPTRSFQQTSFHVGKKLITLSRKQDCPQTCQPILKVERTLKRGSVSCLQTHTLLLFPFHIRSKQIMPREDKYICLDSFSQEKVAENPETSLIIKTDR